MSVASLAVAYHAKSLSSAVPVCAVVTAAVVVVVVVVVRRRWKLWSLVAIMNVASSGMSDFCFNENGPAKITAVVLHGKDSWSLLEIVLPMIGSKHGAVWQKSSCL